MDNVSAADIERMSDEEFSKFSRELESSNQKTDETPKEEEVTPPSDEEAISEEQPKDIPENTNTETPTATEEEDTSTPSETPQEDKVEEVEPDYKKLYSEIMKPIKANGKLMEIKSPDEAISLMQKGANYNKKMNEISAHRSIISMLEANNLLDKEKLSLFIDLDKKDPAALKKFFSDKDIDPLEIDLEEPSEYNPQKNFVSPQVVDLKDTIDDLRQSEQGQALIDSIYTQWDTPSQEALCSNPNTFVYLKQAKESGLYDKTMAELERQQTLGIIPRNTPTYDAYVQIERAFLNQPTSTEPAKEATPSKADVDKRIKATQSTRNTKTTAIKKPTPSEIEKMSDEEFSKYKHLFM